MENRGFSKVPQVGRYAACKAVFDPDLEQGGNINVVVRRESGTGEPLTGVDLKLASKYRRIETLVLGNPQARRGRLTRGTR